MHLTLLLALFMPVLSIIAPLVLWLARKDPSHFIDDHGKETLNFHISILIYYGVSILLCFILIGFPLVLCVYILAVIGMIKATIAANRAEYYRYPACLRLIH